MGYRKEKVWKREQERDDSVFRTRDVVAAGEATVAILHQIPHGGQFRGAAGNSLTVGHLERVCFR
jgi:hypothetical protein